ncbi:choice-of-anchor Q domain-containing protein [Planctomycetota bacterium]
MPFTTRFLRSRPNLGQQHRQAGRLEPLEDRRVLATFQALADVADGEPGSLRAAVIAANQNGEDDVIELAEGTYNLTLRRVDERYTRDDAPTILNPAGGDLDLTEVGKQIVIRGGGSATTVIDVSQISDRAFDVGVGVDAVFEGITIQGGSRVTAGGGINAGRNVNPFETTEEEYGSLTIRDSVLRNNRSTYEGGGLNNWGTLTIERSQFIDNYADYEGGGIEHGGGGHATIIDSSFFGNRADYEGAAISVGTHTVGRTSMSIVGSTLANNRARYSGGGIEATATSLSIMNSTLSNNQAGHEGDSINASFGAVVDANHVTMVHGSGSPLGLNGPIRASNSIFTGNRQNDTGDGFTSRGNNVITKTGERGIRRDDGTNLIGVDARLESLADNGGPTMTHRLRLGSPAIDHAGDGDDPIATDQRGVVRTIDGNGDGIVSADAGAVEAPRLVIYHVNSNRDVIDTNLGNGEVDTGIEGEVTFRAAVMEANALGERARIVLPAGTFLLDQGKTDNDDPDEDLAAEDDIDLYGEIAIVGAGADLTIIDAGRRSGVIEVHASAHVDIADLALQNGSWNGGIANHGNLEVRKVSILNGFAVSDNQEGGGISNWGSLTVFESIVQGNSSGAGGLGGGIANHGDVVIDRTTFHDNSSGASGKGGGFANLGTARITASTFSENSSGARGEGGAIHNLMGELSIANSTISGNSSGASGRGGGVFVEAGRVGIVSSTIVNNSTTAGGDDGGGITVATDGKLSIASTIVAQNDSGQVRGDFEDEGFNFIGGDPRLDRLADNGGPTLTHLPRSGSPVIDAGNRGSLTTDQRGSDRTFDDPRVPNEPFWIIDDAVDHPFLATDGTDIGSVEATYEFTRPEAHSDYFYAFGGFQSDRLEGQATNVLTNDEWLLPLQAVLVDDVQHGELILEAGGTFTYVPEFGFRGQDQFTYLAFQFDFDPVDDFDELDGQSELVTVTIDIIAAASISGQSYIDRDDDGIFDGTDAGLAGTQFRLFGADKWGNSVIRQTASNSRGDYRFDDLPPGDYTVRKQQPEQLFAGKISLGNAGGIVESRREFEIELDEGTIASNYRFAELLPERPPIENPNLPIREIPGVGDRLVGDVNDDGIFDSSDLVLIFQQAKYEVVQPEDVTFEQGDWNDDGLFDSSDLVLAFQMNHYERDEFLRSPF